MTVRDCTVRNSQFIFAQIGLSSGKTSALSFAPGRGGEGRECAAGNNRSARGGREAPAANWYAYYACSKTLRIHARKQTRPYKLHTPGNNLIALAFRHQSFALRPKRVFGHTLDNLTDWPRDMMFCGGNLAPCAPRLTQRLVDSDVGQYLAPFFHR